ncbi:alkylated DNA repair protein alkb-like protein 4 [Plakobranchus ocellatus]|uniref:Alkylated DNA repair protein alkb-like protein 4 n=1 Tax=Plakobranchus ocellatus TaxID=259542 RepID=A0AAV3ZY41_9GAST|nr:alkylated DNA repair protein alkb-like protein 4 [Plakobranchus ocellatus]
MGLPNHKVGLDVNNLQLDSSKSKALCQNQRKQTCLNRDTGNKVAVDQDQQICGCKGIRSCGLCEGSNSEQFSSKAYVNSDVYNFCIECQTSGCSNSNVHAAEPFQTCSGKTDHKKYVSALCNLNCQVPMDFKGVMVIKDFVTEEEESVLCNVVYQTDFVNSQSGRRKQDYGPKVNFKKKKLKFDCFTGLPSYSRYLYERMKALEGLADFEPVELCNLEYCKERGAHIDPHFDDAWLWGERLITLNLLSDSVLSFTSDMHPGSEVRVPLPRRSLIVVQAEARHVWKHGISRADVNGLRIAMTFRELSDEFKDGGMREDDGKELLTRALAFDGFAVGAT